MIEECDPSQAECFNDKDKDMILEQLRAHNIYVRDEKGNVGTTEDWKGNFKRQLLKALQYSSDGSLTAQRAEDEADEAQKVITPSQVISTPYHLLFYLKTLIHPPGV